MTIPQISERAAVVIVAGNLGVVLDPYYFERYYIDNYLITTSDWLIDYKFSSCH